MRDTKGRFVKGHKAINNGRGCYQKGVKHKIHIDSYGFRGKKHTEETKHKMAIKKIIHGKSYLLSPLRYGDDWDDIRNLILYRDNWTCQNCNKINCILDIHHINPFMETFDNSLSNLTSLCRSCHMKEEAKLNIIRRKKCVTHLKDGQ